MSLKIPDTERIDPVGAARVRGTVRTLMCGFSSDNYFLTLCSCTRVSRWRLKITCSSWQCVYLPSMPTSDTVITRVCVCVSVRFVSFWPKINFLLHSVFNRRQYTEGSSLETPA